jgi:hypothetical protein
VDDARRASSQQRADFEAALARLDDQAGRVFDYFFAVALVGHGALRWRREAVVFFVENPPCSPTLRCVARKVPGELAWDECDLWWF